MLIKIQQLTTGNQNLRNIEDNNVNGDKLVLVTGATRGIGKSIAEEFSTLGYQLILTGTNSESVSALNQSCNENTRYVAVDFSNPASCTQFDEYLRALPRLEACIYCTELIGQCGVEKCRL